jgi:hypothetical protein
MGRALAVFDYLAFFTERVWATVLPCGKTEKKHSLKPAASELLYRWYL